MIFRNAKKEELNDILKLYKSVIGTEFCAWNDEYPGETEINFDFSTNNLYILTDGEKIAGALSVVPENELDGFSCFKVNNAKELARIVVAREYRGKGLAYQMVEKALEMLKNDGILAVHLSVANKNIPALKTYKKHGFQIMDEVYIYGGKYYLIEKLL